MGKKRTPKVNQNWKFLDSAIVNNATYVDYLDRFRKLALSMFEWINLPRSMNGFALEEALYYNGMASILEDKEMGIINTKCASNGRLNIYGLPTSLNCYSFEYQSLRNLYTGLKDNNYNDAILVMNNIDRIPTVRFNGTIRTSFI